MGAPDLNRIPQAARNFRRPPDLKIVHPTQAEEEDDDVLTSAGKITKENGSFSGGREITAFDEEEKEYLELQDAIGAEALADANSSFAGDADSIKEKMLRENIDLATASFDELEKIAEENALDSGRSALQKANKVDTKIQAQKIETLRPEIEAYNQEMATAEETAFFQEQARAQEAERAKARLILEQQKQENVRQVQIQKIRDQIAAWDDGSDNTAVQRKEQHLPNNALREQVQAWSREMDRLDGQEIQNRKDLLQAANREKIRAQIAAWESENEKDNNALELKTGKTKAEVARKQRAQEERIEKHQRIREAYKKNSEERDKETQEKSDEIVFQQFRKEAHQKIQKDLHHKQLIRQREKTDRINEINSLIEEDADDSDFTPNPVELPDSIRLNNASQKAAEQRAQRIAELKKLQDAKALYRQIHTAEQSRALETSEKMRKKIQSEKRFSQNKDLQNLFALLEEETDPQKYQNIKTQIDATMNAIDRRSFSVSDNAFFREGVKKDILQANEERQLALDEKRRIEQENATLLKDSEKIVKPKSILKTIGSAIGSWFRK